MIPHHQLIQLGILVLFYSLCQSPFHGSTYAKAARSKFLSSPSLPQQLHQLANLSNIKQLTVQGDLLKPLLIPRVSDTEGNKKVQEFLKKTLTQLNYHVEEDPFTADTPYATKDPNAQHKLVLAAHFDSKYFAEFEFIGATDSSVPCAIMLDVAKSLNSLLEDRLQRSTARQLGVSGISLNHMPTLQLIFFDGEEAFKDWTSTDSLYGSKHLAEKWSRQYIVQDGQDSAFGGGHASNILSTIDAIVLLDLLGYNPLSLINTHFDTTWAWDRLVMIERSLSEAQLLSPVQKQHVERNQNYGYFSNEYNMVHEHAVDDDHRPFREKGVPIVHVIAYPFPPVWHRQSDNAENLSEDVIQDLALIFRVFVAEYLGLLL